MTLLFRPRLQKKRTIASKMKNPAAAPIPIPTPSPTESLLPEDPFPAVTVAVEAAAVRVPAEVLVLSIVGIAVVYMDPPNDVVTGMMEATGVSISILSLLDLSQQVLFWTFLLQQ